MTNNLTPWYPPHIKPVRVGVYETDEAGIFQHWNGEWWGCWDTTADEAAISDSADEPSQMLPSPRWRGLKSPA